MSTGLEGAIAVQSTRLDQVNGDHLEFAVIIPTDPRLPDGGGGQLSGIYNITQAANARLTDNFVTLADR